MENQEMYNAASGMIKMCVYLYVNAKAEGFDDEQAMKIVTAYINATIQVSVGAKKNG